MADMKHRTYGGSTIGRTIACPGWVKESAGVPRTTSIYAEKGTALHDVMEELVLEELASPELAIGLSYNGIEISKTMHDDKIVPALAAFHELCEQFQVDEFEPEVECDFGPDVGGYADLVLRGTHNGEPIVIVADWKFGDGVQVYPDDLPQAKFYGCAARNSSSAKDLFEGAKYFAAVIIQPGDRDDDLRVWVADIDVLDEFERHINRAVKEAKSKRPPIAAGSHCKFCPASSLCPERSGKALRALRMQPDDLEILHESLELVGELKDWIKAVEAAAFEQLNAGAEVKGWKLVAKRATEKWHPERVDAAIKYLRRRLGGIKNITKTDILSPAQMRKVIKAKKLDIELDSYTMKQSTGTTMAPEDDKRPAVLAGEAMAAALKSLS